ncbi:MAG: hypothetical protein KDK36_14350, partial [Leptospiraceae bacterium]|nr:hypothetical protein [Leptospiraceae bacterium]
KFSNIYDSDSLEKEISVILLKKQEFGKKLARIILVFFAGYWLAINSTYFFSNNKIAMIMSFNVISFLFVYLYKIEDYNSITKKLASLFFLLFFISPFLLSIVLRENDFTKNAISFVFSISLLSIMVIAFTKVFINHKFDSQVDVLKEKINLIRK